VALAVPKLRTAIDTDNESVGGTLPIIFCDTLKRKMKASASLAGKKMRD
jgi:hypothetical protein